MDWSTAAQAFASLTGLIGGAAGIGALVRLAYERGRNEQRLSHVENKVEELQKCRNQDNAEIHGRISQLHAEVNNRVSQLKDQINSRVSQLTDRFIEWLQRRGGD